MAIILHSTSLGWLYQVHQTYCRSGEGESAPNPRRRKTSDPASAKDARERGARKEWKFKQKVSKTIDFLFLQEFYYSRLIFKTIFPLWQLRLGNLVTIREANLSFYRL